MGCPEYRPSQDRQGTEKVIFQRFGDGREWRSTLRQVGWLGATGRFYALYENPAPTEPGSFQPLWIEVHSERMLSEAELREAFGEPIAIDGGM